MNSEVISAYLKDNIERAAGICKVVPISKFLDSCSLSSALNIIKNYKDEEFFFWGGYENAERKMMFYIPQSLHGEREAEKIFGNWANCPLTVVRVKKDKFSRISHSDYLGALMGLGLKREMIGDICTREDGCDIITTGKTADFIKDNLTSAGRATLTTSIVPIKDLIVPEAIFEEISFTVSSQRLDAVIGEVFSLSRSDAVKAISQGLVFVNDEQMLKPDKHILPCSKIVLRHRGRAILGEDFYKTKKGRIRINAKKFK